jgi:hypothetical protein
LIKVKLATLQRILDLLPSRTGLSQPVDDFLAAIHSKGSDAITQISRGEMDVVTIPIKVEK